jgi:hypothetical protein
MKKKIFKDPDNILLMNAYAQSFFWKIHNSEKVGCDSITEEVSFKISGDSEKDDGGEESKEGIEKKEVNVKTNLQTYNEFVWVNQMICSNKWFNGTILFSIIVAGVLVGIQSYPEMQSPGIEIADLVIQIIFSLECVFKIFAEGVHPANYWIGPERNWNNFDFWLVFFCWIPFAGNVAFLRLLRLMRLLKLVGKVKQLQVIVMGLAKGLSAVSYIILLMLLIFYLFAVMGVSSFRDNDPFHFGSLGVAMLSLFRAATLEDWGDIMFINWFGCDSQYDATLGVYTSGEEETINTEAGQFPGLG